MNRWRDLGKAAVILGTAMGVAALAYINGANGVLCLGVYVVLMLLLTCLLYPHPEEDERRSR